MNRLSTHQFMSTRGHYPNMDGDRSVVQRDSRQGDAEQNEQVLNVGRNNCDDGENKK